MCACVRMCEGTNKRRKAMETLQGRNFHCCQRTPVKEQTNAERQWRRGAITGGSPGLRAREGTNKRRKAMETDRVPFIFKDLSPREGTNKRRKAMETWPSKAAILMLYCQVKEQTNAERQWRLSEERDKFRDRNMV